MNAEESVKVRAVLLKAAEIIELQGWTQKRMRDFSTGAVCMVGAIRQAACGTADGNVTDREALSIFHIAHNVLWHNLPLSPTVFNDMKGQTKERVVAALRQVAA